MKSAPLLSWDYFLVLEKDLVNISDYLELCGENYKAYGPRLMQIVLSAGSELDNALKGFFEVLPGASSSLPKNPNMKDYRELLAKKAKRQFDTAEVKILHTELVLIPWKNALDEDKQSIPWWKNYNNVKHNRLKHYHEANLETALMLISALFVVDAYALELTQTCDCGFTRILDWNTHERFDE